MQGVQLEQINRSCHRNQKAAGTCVDMLGFFFESTKWYLYNRNARSLSWVSAEETARTRKTPQLYPQALSCFEIIYVLRMFSLSVISTRLKARTSFALATAPVTPSFLALRQPVAPASLHFATYLIRLRICNCWIPNTLAALLPGLYFRKLPQTEIARRTILHTTTSARRRVPGFQLRSSYARSPVFGAP